MGVVMRRLSRRLRNFGAGMMIFAGLAVAPGWAAPTLAVQAVTVARTEAGARVTLDLSRDAAVQTQFLGAPKPRFVIDLPEAQWRATDPRGAGIVANVRHGEHTRSARLVLDLKHEGRLVASGRRNIGEGVRLTFDLAAASGSDAEPPQVKPPAPAAGEPAPILRAGLAAREPAGKRVVVVDPGHGGRDPGALGTSSGREKDYNLAAAMVLRTQLEKRGYAVFLTRDTDVFLPLAERVKIARDRKADLFISLHSDADPKGKAKGATVYTLSQRGVQRTRTVMDAQDWTVDVGEAGGSARSILLDLTQRETKDHSSRFAEALIDRLGDRAPLTRRTPASAGFFVLLAPDVPAVLLEMGFVTHAEDERRLADANQRKVLMDAVAASVDDYFETRKTYASVSP